MEKSSFENDRSLRQARAEYFEVNGFPSDGGYNDKWIPLKFGPFTFYLYNSKSRKKAVPLHDLHHIVTDYGTDPVGEAEIAAWELAAGTHSRHFATLINMSAIVYGTILYPGRVFRAYVLGLYSTTLYSEDMSESLLAKKGTDVRERLLPKVSPLPRLQNYFGFAALFLCSVGLFLLPVLLAVSIVY